METCSADDSYLGTLRINFNEKFSAESVVLKKAYWEGNILKLEGENSSVNDNIDKSISGAFKCTSKTTSSVNIMDNEYVSVNDVKYKRVTPNSPVNSDDITSVTNRGTGSSKHYKHDINYITINGVSYKRED